MSEIVNLKQFRKRKARAAAERQAAANRAAFGRTKEQKARDANERTEARRRLDQLRREPPRGDEPEDG